MKTIILTGSPRRKGNTSHMVRVFEEELRRQATTVDVVELHVKTILPCVDCKECQKDHQHFACILEDDMDSIAQQILQADRIVFATPIYSWFCTPPMKSLLDRCVRAMNKFYSKVKGPALWAGKEVVLLLSCGYPPEKGADLFREGMKRYCKHSQLNYKGEISLHDPGSRGVFWTQEKEKAVRDFAQAL